MKIKILKILDVIIEYSVYGIIIFIPLSIARVSIFAGIAVLFFLIKQVISPDFSGLRANKVFFLLLLIFFIFMAASLFNSGPLIAKSLKALFLKWGRFPLIVWMIVDTFRDTRRIVKAAGVIVFISMLVGISVLSQKFLGLEFFRHMQMRAGSVTGPFANQNSLAAFLTCIIPIVLCLSLWNYKKVWVKLILVLITIMLMLSSWWTICRGGWVGLTAGLICLVLLINYNRLSKKAFWALLLVGNFLCVPLVAFTLMSFRHKTDRFILMHGAWRMIVEHPFLGKGLGTYMDYSAQYTNNYGIYYAHNCLLQIWAESGIFSLLSFLMLNGYVFYNTIKIISSLPVSLGSTLLIGLNAGLLGFLVHSLFDVHFYSFQASFIFWMVLGLTVALSSSLKVAVITERG